MARSYLRILFSSEHELPFIAMNSIEASEFVDEVLVCEANFTHTGEPRELIFPDKYSDKIWGHLKNVRYVPMDITHSVKPFEGSSVALHQNEQVIRNAFVDNVSIKPSDIVIAVDADEVIFRQSYKTIFAMLRNLPLHKSLHLRMHMAFYKLNYLWEGRRWRAPVACHARHFLGDEHAQWRYQGWRLPRPVGTHFAWVMTPEQMAAKILRYSHRVELEHLADPQLLREAVDRRLYIFDSSEDFRIKEVKSFDPHFQPSSINLIQDQYADLFSSAWTF